VRLLGVQGGLLLVSIPLPIVLPLVFTLLPVALVLLPFVFLAYGRLLINVGAFTVRMIIDEQQNNSLSLLRPTRSWRIMQPSFRQYLGVLCTGESSFQAASGSCWWPSPPASLVHRRCSGPRRVCR
jgi:hypothetical protein